MVERLEDDHTNARALADGLRGIPGLELDPTPPQTNMVFFNLARNAPVGPQELARRVGEQGVVLDAYDRRIRLVTHYWISAKDVDKAVGAFREALAPQ